MNHPNFDSIQIGNKSKEMLVATSGSFPEAIKVCEDYSVIYATQQELLCSGYWSAVARDLEARREALFSTWR